MHTFGFPVHMNELVQICEEWNIPIVEDAAESIGSQYYGKMTGGFGQMGTFSLNGNKTITCGGGGVSVTTDINLGFRAKHLTTTAKQAHPFEFRRSNFFTFFDKISTLSQIFSNHAANSGLILVVHPNF